MGMSLWAGWGSKHDKDTMDREEQADKEPETVTATRHDGANARPLNDTETKEGKKLGAKDRPDYSRSRSRRRTVTDEHQTDGDDVDENTSAAKLLALREKHNERYLSPNSPTTEMSQTPDILLKVPSNEQMGSETNLDLKRPKAGGVAFPFSVKKVGGDANASTLTLTSATGVPPAEDLRMDDVMKDGVSAGKSSWEANGTSPGESTQKEQRPPLESFVTASEGLDDLSLPPPKPGSITPDNRSVRSYTAW